MQSVLISSDGEDMYSTIIVKSQVNSCSGPKYGTKYDLSESCQTCGTGAKALGPRYLEMRKVPKYAIFQTLDGDVLINAALKNIIEEELVGSSSFLWPVLDAKTQKPMPLWEIRAEITMPKFSAKTTGFEVEKACKECGRDGYFGIPNVPFRLVYPIKVLSTTKATVLATWEHFGFSRLRSKFEDSVFAVPIIIVSDELRKIFEHNKITGISFESVLFE